jgi:hypothetical protein
MSENKLFIFKNNFAWFVFKVKELANTKNHKNENVF